MQNNIKLTMNANGKINLYLDVLNRRHDGYHNIRSVMQSVSLHDTVTLEVSASDGLTIEIGCSSKNIKCDESNLVYKAADLFLKKSGIECVDLRFYIEKNIPVSAGMAGGSADAACALKLLNEAYGLPYTENELCAIGKEIGADVPFCIKGGTCICEGTGEFLTRLPTFSDIFLVCAIDSSSVSTPKAFGMLDKKYGNDCADSSCLINMVRAVIGKDVNAVASALYNKFEDVIIPENHGVKLIKGILSGNGAIGTLMSGSGPSVFGIFKTEDDAKNAASALACRNIFACVCKTI